MVKVACSIVPYRVASSPLMWSVLVVSRLIFMPVGPALSFLSGAWKFRVQAIVIMMIIIVVIVVVCEA